MACCVHRIPRPTCRDDGDTPLWWARDGDVYTSDFQKWQAKFLRGRLDNPNQLEIAQEIRFCAQRILRSIMGIRRLRHHRIAQTRSPDCLRSHEVSRWSRADQAATTRGPTSTASEGWHGWLSIATSAKPT